MTKHRAANEHEYACQYRIEKIESANGGDADHEKQCAFNAHIGERLMQALEDSIAAFLCCFVSAGAKIDHRTPRERCFAAE
jgi:hypothetical protein